MPHIMLIQHVIAPSLRLSDALFIIIFENEGNTQIYILTFFFFQKIIINVCEVSSLSTFAISIKNNL